MGILTLQPCRTPPNCKKTLKNLDGSIESEVRPKIKFGTRLIRQWRGETHEVEVSKLGYRISRATYRSLSEIARKITGTRWSGPAFFGIEPASNLSRLRMTSKHVRCAVYTRKSSEEGLEQSFNSLEAQREACRAFILSQKHEGWIAVNIRYDDGGFSGGTMERPALKQLLEDILGGKIETVVVYKVDRLTRSLSDFPKSLTYSIRTASASYRHSAVQHNDFDGTAHFERPAVVRPIRARSNRRKDSRQSCRFEKEGYVDGRRRSSGLRLRRPSPRRQPNGSKNGTHESFENICASVVSVSSKNTWTVRRSAARLELARQGEPQGVPRTLGGPSIIF